MSNSQSQPDAWATKNEPDEQVLGQYIPLIYHYNMLQDADRVGAFRAAIELLVKPGMHVVELGGGTGILSSFAARQNARVTCVERNPELVACATRFIRANGLDDRVTIVQADAAKFVPDTPVDVVVCEMLHVGLLREKQAQVIAAFKQNYVRKHGPKLPIFAPETSVLMVQPVEQSFDFDGYYAPIPVFQAPILNQPRTTELTALNPYCSIEYAEAIPTRFSIGQSMTAASSGCANALRFVTQNVIAIDMNAQRAITWPNQCLVLPLETSFDISEGQEMDMAFQYDAGGSIEDLMKTMTLTPSVALAKSAMTDATVRAS